MSTKSRNLFIFKKCDNVATAIRILKKNEIIDCLFNSSKFQLLIQEKIAFGHKVAIKKIAKGEKVIKCGFPIGLANSDIEIGHLVHIHNLESSRGRGDLKNIK